MPHIGLSFMRDVVLPIRVEKCQQKTNMGMSSRRYQIAILMVKSKIKDQKEISKSQNPRPIRHVTVAG